MDSRYQPYDIQQQRRASREQLRKHFRRNQAIGLLLFAVAVLVYRLLHTPSGWILPAGWWRIW